MKIEHKIEKSSLFAIYPIWKKNGTIQTGHLPGQIAGALKEDLPFLDKSLKSKKYFAGPGEAVVVFLETEEHINPGIIRKFMVKCLSIIKSNLARSCDIFLYPELWNLEAERTLFIGTEALLLAGYSYDVLKHKKEPQFDPDSVQLVIGRALARAEALVKKASQIKEAVFLARDLVNGPANYVTIDYLEQQAQTISKDHNIELTIHKEKELRALNMNLLLAVGQSSSQETSLVEMHYRPDSNAPTICLVAKGIVYDTGGLDLKTSGTMDEMKSDMGAAAVVLAVLKAAALLKLNINITALIPLAENCIGNGAYRPGDVITGHKGISVEIKSTDAEGRLILADALSYSDKFKPLVTIDIATLTGAAIVALGPKMSAAFFRTPVTKEHFFTSAEQCGEPVWELPLFEEYKNMLESDTADTTNLGNPIRQGSTIIAALFLSNFVDNKNWIHLDIAGPAFLEKAWDIYPKGGTGIMVRTLVNYLEILSQ